MHVYATNPQALRFGEKCAKVSNDADINQAAMTDMLAAIDKEMDVLEKASEPLAPIPIRAQ